MLVFTSTLLSVCALLILLSDISNKQKLLALGHDQKNLKQRMRTGNAASMGSPRVISSSVKVQVHLKLKLIADHEFSPKVFLTLKMHMQIS